jgi:hypothetical protein
MGQKCPVAPVSAMDGMEGGEEPRLTGEVEIEECICKSVLLFTWLRFMFGCPLTYVRGTWTNTRGSSRLR